MATTRNFKSASGYKKAQAYIHMHIHKGPSKNPYPVKIAGKTHKVIHARMGLQAHNHPSNKKV